MIKCLNFRLIFTITIILIIFLVRELLQATLIIRARGLQGQSSQKEKGGDEERENETPCNQLILEKYTEVLNPTEKTKNETKSKNDGYPQFIVLESLRFFLFQIIIVSLQNLNRCQSVIAFALNLAYFCFFIGALLKAKVFKSKIYLVKEIAQEISLMVLLSAITLFSFTQDSSFASSNAYKVIEILAILSILAAAGGELVVMVKSLYEQILACIRYFSEKCSKNNKINQEEKSERVETEGKEILDSNEKDQKIDKIEKDEKSKKDRITKGKSTKSVRRGRREGAAGRRTGKTGRKEVTRGSKKKIQRQRKPKFERVKNKEKKEKEEKEHLDIPQTRIRGETDRDTVSLSSGRFLMVDKPEKVRRSERVVNISYNNKKRRKKVASSGFHRMMRR